MKIFVPFKIQALWTIKFQIIGIYNEIKFIIQEIKDDGTMARRDDLMKFAKEHDLKILTIAALVEYRKKEHLS